MIPGATPATRRAFLRLPLAAGLAGLTRHAPAAAVDLPGWVRTARAELPATAAVAYFQSGAYGPSPAAVMARTRELLEIQNRCPAHPENLGLLRAAEEDCRRLVARLCGADPAEVALTANTTSGLNTVLWSFSWRPGDEVVTSDEEHPGLLVPLDVLRRRFGVVVRRVPFPELPEAALRQVSPRTRLVALSHVSRGTGRLAPAAELAAALRARGIPLLLDGAQGPGNVAVDFHALGCDYYSLCGHKWLLGPKGTGALLVRAGRLAEMPPSWGGSGTQASLDHYGRIEWQPDARRFEFGTRFLAGLGGWHEALRWLEGIGWDRIRARQAALTARAAALVAGHRGRLELVSPADDPARNGIVVVRLPAGHTGAALYDRLREQDRILASPVTAPRDLRICLHFFNTEPEVDLVVARIAAHCA